ncbi:MAG TPA: NACHT domain-containing protein [Vicingaceae bacterium]|nr:NACHT domain-containing protein [Vicingaceae bacterium]
MDKPEELLVSNLILPIVKDLILPKVQAVFNKFSVTNTTQSKVEENFDSYLTQRYEKFLTIDTLVFPNKQTLLDVLYQPLTLSCQDGNRNSKVEIKIDNYPDNLIPEYFRVIIEDTAGMGKSTITKKLFQSIILEKKGIPILIELSQINNKNNILKEIQNQLSTIGKKLSQDLILKLINEGDFIFLFDGFDEIALDDREYVVRELHKFIEKANHNYFLITSRPEDSLASFGDFQKFSVNPLKKGEAYSLLSKYDTYSYHSISKNLIKQLNDNPDDSLQEYLSNPFLVSLLYKSYEFKKDIPVKKSQFYQQVYDALFETHDLSKEGYLKRDKYSNLHIDDFERVLRHIGYFTSIENKVEYDKNTIIKFIDKAKKHLSDLNFRSSDFLKDLIKTVPIFKKEGNYFKWGHKSLQDYFAAKFIWIDSKESQLPILEKIYKDPKVKRFHNLLTIYYELDPNGFDNTILKWTLTDFQTFVASSYKDWNKKDKRIKTRIENHYNKSCVIAITKKEDYDIIRSGKDKRNRDTHEYYRKKVNFKYSIKNSNHTTFNYFENPKVVSLSFIGIDSRKHTLIELISSTHPKLAEYRRHKVHLKDLPNLKEDCIYKLDDNKLNDLNQDAVFETTNDLIMSDYSFKFDPALKKLNEILKAEINKVKDELLDW